MKKYAGIFAVTILVISFGCINTKRKTISEFHIDTENAAKILSNPEEITIQDGGLRNYMSSTYTVSNKKIPKISNEMTASAWIVQRKWKGYQTIVYKGNRSLTPEQVQFDLDLCHGLPEFKYKDKDGNWRGILINHNKYKNGEEIQKLHTKKWHHIAATFKNGLIRIFVNGKMVAENGPRGQSGKLQAGNSPLFIGSANPSRSNNRAYSFDGLLNDIRIYPQALTKNEIEKIYNTTKLNYPDKIINIKGQADPAMADFDPEFRNKLKITSEYEKNIPGDKIKNRKTTAGISLHKGVPSLFVDKKPVFPMQMMPSPWNPTEKTFNSCRDFAAAGMDLYSDIIYTAFGRGYSKEKWWLGEGKYDFTKVDERIKTIIKANPKALILIRIKLNPPRWWQKKHPEEISVYFNNGKYISTKIYASTASEVWEKSYKRMLRDFIKHIESSEYAGHIYGYSPAGGMASEWFWYGHSKGLVDYSDAARKRFRKWLIKKYNNNISELRDAWKDEKITFATVEVPSPTERTKNTGAVFIDPVKSKKVTDHRDFMSDTVSENIIESCKICKKETNFNKLTCVFYGYSMLFEGNKTGTKLGNNGFQGLGNVIKSEYVDALCSPTDYRQRRGGEPGLFISAYNGSYRLHNKLFWDEADIRTHFYSRHVHGRTSNMKETISVLERAFGYSLSKGTAMWWFLIVGDAVFHHDKIMESIARMQTLGGKSMNTDKTPVAQAALIVDEKCMNYSTYGGNNILKAHIWETYINTAYSGAPFDIYLQSDIINKRVPDYKLYVFANAFKYNKEFTEAVKKKLSRNNAVAVWCYAPGYISENGFEADNMEKLTGIKLKASDKKSSVQFSPTNTSNPITALCGNTNFGTYSISPVFHVNDPKAEILGKVAGKPSMAIKNMGKWKSVYTLTPLTKELLKGLLDYAGVHVYNRGYDIIYANKSYVMLHSGVSGEKTILLPGNYDVTEILSGRKKGTNISSFTEQIDAPQTKIYKLSRIK